MEEARAKRGFVSRWGWSLFRVGGKADVSHIKSSAGLGNARV